MLLFRLLYLRPYLKFRGLMDRLLVILLALWVWLVSVKPLESFLARCPQDWQQLNSQSWGC